MYEVYRHKKKLRFRLHKDSLAPMPAQAGTNAWELLRTTEDIDEDLKKEIERRGYALSRINLTFKDLWQTGSPSSGDRLYR